MRITTRPAAVVAATVTAFAALGAGAGHAGERTDGSPSGARCREHSFPVEIAGTTYRVWGQLCSRGRVTSRTPVQVLLHGGTYDHSYWNWPYQPQRYSYVEHATRQGYATLNLDRLGYGRSSRPDPTALDFEVGGRAVHQVVQQLREGALGPSFDTIVLNGHSMGGLVAERAAAYGGVDAVIISGIPARRGEAQPIDGDVAPLSSGDAMSDDVYPFYPAERDPKFAAQPWAPGYLTTLPGTRDDVFLYEGTYDPAIVPVEEALKDTLTIAELRMVRPAPGTRAAHTGAAHIPTAYVLGRHDTLLCRTGDCTTDPAGQGADYIVERSGHSINTSLGAPRFYRWTFDWLAKQGIHKVCGS